MVEVWNARVSRDERDWISCDQINKVLFSGTKKNTTCDKRTIGRFNTASAFE